MKNVLFTVENTDPKVPWLTSYFESLLVQCWYPMTVCTSSYHLKLLLKKFTDTTCDDASKLNSKISDFGFRGSTSVESAGIGGCANMVHFNISDNVTGNVYAETYYGATDPPGTSVIAAEHSTITTWGKDGESDVVKHLLQTFETCPLSVVADSYDIWSHIENILGQDHIDLIKSRKVPLIVRPDSGDPAFTLVNTLNKLEKIFGFTKNSKGYKLLPPYVAVIQGDGISPETMPDILHVLESSKWSLDNVTFGSGGALLQKMNRDTQRCAYKCCLATIDGKEVWFTSRLLHFDLKHNNYFVYVLG